jgi:hypothetical protein
VGLVPVAQVSKPAVSPISKSAGLRIIQLPVCRTTSCGFGNPRHSRFGNLRYTLE